MGRGETACEVDLQTAMSAVQELVSGLGVDRMEQDMVGHFVDVASGVLPGCCVAARTVQSSTLNRVTLATSGEMICGDLEILALPREEHDRVATAVPPEKRRMQVQDAYSPIFVGCVHGEAVALVADDRLLGVVNLESATGLPDSARGTFRSLAALLARAIRNRRLSRNPRFLRKWLASTIDNANALIFVVDPGRRITLCNRALCDLLGAPPKQVLERDLLDWVCEAQHDLLKQKLDQALEGRSLTNQELTLTRADGGPVAAIFNMARPTEVVESVIAIGQDVTAIRMLEERMVQAEKLASLGQLAAGVVHEINNPLTSITVYADYLIKRFRERECDPRDVAMLEKILEGSNRILKFTRDLVDYGKPSGSELDVVAFNEIVAQAISFCEHVIDQAGASLNVELGEDLPPVYGVKDQLQQVLINLLTNACHAVQSDGGQLKVTTRRQGSRSVAVEVADNGCGIPVSELPMIFEPFFTTKAPGEGTGLGLSIVKKIVDHHNGQIMVESEEGQGSTFCIALPTGHR